MTTTTIAVVDFLTTSFTGRSAARVFHQRSWMHTAKILD